MMMRSGPAVERVSALEASERWENVADFVWKQSKKNEFFEREAKFFKWESSAMTIKLINDENNKRMQQMTSFWAEFLANIIIEILRKLKTSINWNCRL